MSVASSRRPKVVVCGAGPVGALAAIYASQRNYDVEVYELRDDLRKKSTIPLNFTKSINLALAQRGINALRHANCGTLLEDILEESIPLRARMIHGRTVGGSKTHESQPYDNHGRFNSAVDRGTLNRHLLDALEKMPNVKLNFNHKLTGADFHKNQAWFEPRSTSPATTRSLESTVSFDLFIGADGAHSSTRYHMMKFARMNYQQDYIDCLWCEFRIPPTADDTFALDPNHLHIWPAGSFMFIAIASTDKSFTCTLFASAAIYTHLSLDPAANLLPFFTTHFPGVSPDLITPMDLVSQYTQNPHLPLLSVKCSPHHFEASVVIVGDAAHAMVPFYGQGMNAGFEDVNVLFSKLDACDSIAQALNDYTRQRVVDAHTINDLALNNYREMSAGVKSPVYKVRKWLEEAVGEYMPWTGWRTLYMRVCFENQRYSHVVRDVEFQGRVLAVGAGIGVLALAGVAGLGIRWIRR